MTIHTSSDYDFSVRRAVVEAWKKFALHWRTYLRYLWPFLLMAGIGSGLFVVALSAYLAQHAIPFFAVVKSGLGAQVGLALLLPSWSTLSALVVGLLLWLLGQSGLGGGFALQYKRNISSRCGLCLFKHKVLRRVWLQRSARCLLLLLIYNVLNAMVLGGTVWLTREHTSLWWIPAVMICIGLLIAYSMTFVHYVIYKRTALQSLCATFSHRRLGAMVILFLLTAIPFGAIMLVGQMPTLILLMSKLTNAWGVMLGDTNGLPGYFDVLLFGCMALGSIIGYFLYSIQIGGIVYIAQEKKKTILARRTFAPTPPRIER